MIVFQFIVLFLVVKFRFSTAFTIVKTTRNSTTAIFLLVNGWAKEIIDEDTVKTLKFDPTALDTIAWERIATLKYGGKVPLIKQENGTPDEVMRVELLIINTMQAKVLYDIKVIGEYINPSIVRFRGRLLLAAGIEWGFAGLNAKSATGNVEFAWLNTTDYPFYSAAMYHGINMDVNSLLVMPFAGQDPRMVVINDNKIVICYTHMSRSPRMGIAELVIPDSSSSSSSSETRRRGLRQATLRRVSEQYSSAGLPNATITSVFAAIAPSSDQNPNDPQKNWSPFLYNNSLHFIQHLNPLHVVTTQHYNNDPLDPLYALTVSTADRIAPNWKYGELRGGTNALLVRNNEGEEVYVALFHSSSMLPGNMMKTYWMGGYTFTAHPPFRILTMTEFPIIDNSLYDGPWDALRNRHIDYVPFPNTIFMEREGVVHLSFGWQDHLGCTARMNLSSLLDIMVPVGR